MSFWYTRPASEIGTFKFFNFVYSNEKGVFLILNLILFSQNPLHSGDN